MRVSNEVGEGLGNSHIVRNKRVEFNFFCEILIFRPFFSQPKSQKDTNVAFSESFGCRLSIVIYINTIGQLWLEKSGFQQKKGSIGGSK
jgi:hypothetical protein